jgi:ATP-dependent Clp protease adaptor protein ClpS
MLPHFKEKRMSIDTEVVIDEKIKLEDRLPSKYNVVMLNDEHTPIEFVIGILEMIFQHTRPASENITMEIHNEGAAVVGTYNYEIAEMKANEAITVARSSGFPLNIKLEIE